MSDVIAKGAHAEQLLRDEVLSSAFESLRQSILGQLEDWPIEDAAGAEKLRMSLKLLKGVRSNLEHAVRDGKVAAFRLEEERKKESMLRTMMRRVKS
jgi:hypothetical protein